MRYRQIICVTGPVTDSLLFFELRAKPLMEVKSVQSPLEITTTVTQAPSVKTGKEALLVAINGDEFSERVAAHLSDLAEDKETYKNVIHSMLEWVRFLTKMLEPIDDEGEVKVVAALLCGSLKSKWYILNTSMNYRMVDGEFDPESTYTCVAISLLIDAIEPFADQKILTAIFSSLAFCA